MKLVFLVFSFCFCFSALAQDPRLDSLKQALKNTTKDADKLSLLDAISDIAPDGEWERYSEEMGRLGQQLMSDTNPTLRNTGKRYYSVSLNNKGFIAAEKGDYGTALDYYGQSLKISHELDDKEEIALVLGNIGVIYDRQGDIDEALRNYKMALATQKEMKNSNEMVATYNNIAVIYEQKKYPDSALFYFSQGLQIAELNKYQSNTITTLLSGLGSSLEKKGELDKAMEYYSRGLKMSEQIGDNIGKSNNLRGMASVYVTKNDLNKALDFSRQAVATSRDANNPKTLIPAASLLKSIYEKLGKYKDAYNIYQLEILNRDSLQRKENQRAVIRHQFKYEYDLKEATNRAEQERKDTIAEEELRGQKLIRNGFVGGTISFLLLAGVIFISLRKTAKEKKKSEELLLNILPTEVAEEIKTTGTAKAKGFTMVTVMFTDFKDFTLLGEKVSAELLVEEIHTCFSAFDNMLQKHRIEKIKTIGDAYLCVSGLPVSNYTHASDMINYAFEIRDYMVQRKKEKDAMGETSFELRIGIHTGPVVAGIVGVKKYAYDIWGDTVNIAARMEQNSEAGSVNISGSTYELVKHKFNCTHRGKIQAKNKGAVDMYFVESVRNDIGK